jgi:hypothetical protein
MYRENGFGTRDSRCIALGNRRKDRGGSESRPSCCKYLYRKRIYFFGFFLLPKLVSTEPPI